MVYEILVRNAYPYSRIHKYVFREVGNLVWEDNHVLGRILSQFDKKKVKKKLGFVFSYDIY